MAELADAHGSGPCSARNVGSTPTDGTIFENQGVNHSKISEIFCGYGITAVHQPSKLDIRVRLPLPAPVAKLIKIYQTIFNVAGFPSGQRGQTVNLLAMLSVVRIHLQPPSFDLKTVTAVVAVFLFSEQKNKVRSLPRV